MKVLLFNPPMYAEKYYTEAEECCFGMVGRPVVPHNLLRIATAFQIQQHEVSFRDYAVEGKSWKEALADVANCDLAFTSALHGGTAHELYLRFYEPLHRQKRIMLLCYPEAILDELSSYLHLKADDIRHNLTRYIPPFENSLRINYDLYPYHRTPGKVYVVQAATGCRYNCNFCVWAGKPYKLRPVSEVIRQLRDVNEHRAPRDVIFLLSSQMTSDKAWLEEFVIQKEKYLPTLTFNGDIGIGEVNLQTANLLRRSGIENATVGAEALSDGWLRRFRKGWTYQSIRNGLLLLQEAGVTYHLILRCGIGETAQDIAESIHNIAELSSLGVKPEYVQWGKIYPYPGTAIAHLEGNQTFLPELKTLVEWLRSVGWIK